MHAEYTIRAAKAGVHVLCEKPMAVTVHECRRMIRACEKHHVKLMIAYRLHFEEIRKIIPKRDQFAPELIYFSDCILNDREVEPSGYEGMQDVRIIEALYRAANTGRSVKIPAFVDRKKPAGAQMIRRPGVRKPKLVKVVSASK